jgi:hypothetical protein
MARVYGSGAPRDAGQRTTDAPSPVLSADRTAKELYGVAWFRDEAAPAADFGSVLPPRVALEKGETERSLMKKKTLNAFMDRLQGQRPGPPRAAAVAASAGIATAVVIYRVLRHDAEDE